MQSLAILAGAMVALLLPGAGWWELVPLLCAALWVGRRRSRPVLPLLAAAAFVLARLAAADVAGRPVPCAERLLVEAQITSIPERSDGGWRFDAWVKHPRQRQQGDLLVRIDFPRQGALRPRAGETWQLALGYRAALEGGSGAERVLLRDRIHARARVLVSPLNRRLQPAGPSVLGLRERVAERIHRRAQDPAAAALIAALAVGATGEVSDRQWRVFSATGISHLVAISGMHVTFFAMLSMMGARVLWGRLPALQCLRREAFAAAVGVLLAAGYALLSGFSVPAQRTLVMLLAFVALRETARAARPCATLAMATVAVLGWDPLALLDAGFWLSFAAVAAIILLPGSRILLPGALRAAADVQWTVSLALLPFTLAIFGTFSVAGLAVNVVAIPLFTFLLVPVVLFATVGYLLPGEIATLAADRLVDLAQYLVRPLWAGLTWVADLPGAVLPARPGPLAIFVASGALLLVLLPLGARVRSAAGLVLAWSFLAAWPAPAQHELEIEVLEAGSGAAVLLRTAHHALLAGAAESFGSRGRGFLSRLQPQLRGRLAAGPDVWVLGRIDADRLAGLSAARAGGSDALVFGIATAPRRLPPELVPCRLRRWQWDGVDFELQEAPSGRGCLLSVAAQAHRTVLLVDGDAGDHAHLEAPAETAPDLLLLPAAARLPGAVRGYRVQGDGVQGAVRIAIDAGRQKSVPVTTYWRRLTGERPLQRCTASS
ncbi:MAG: ComEC/Rec2 family competence protein [Steroidobacteraceae bacterium]